jgi:hypothetical protein
VASVWRRRAITRALRCKPSCGSGPVPLQSGIPIITPFLNLCQTQESSKAGVTQLCKRGYHAVHHCCVAVTTPSPRGASCRGGGPARVPASNHATLTCSGSDAFYARAAPLLNHAAANAQAGGIPFGAQLLTRFTAAPPLSLTGCGELLASARPRTQQVARQREERGAGHCRHGSTLRHACTLMLTIP